MDTALPDSFAIEVDGPGSSREDNQSAPARDSAKKLAPAFTHLRRKAHKRLVAMGSVLRMGKSDYLTFAKSRPFIGLMRPKPRDAHRGRLNA
jgi:hypothetical protein